MIGRPLFEAVPELLDLGIKPLLDRVLATGQPYFGKERVARLERGEGRLETTFYNFLYSPTRTPGGEVDGVLSIAFDVTDEIQTRRHTAALYRLSSAATRGAELQVLLQLVTDEATALTGADCGAFLSLRQEPPDRPIRIEARAGAHGDILAEADLPRLLPLLVPIFRGEGVVRIDDLGADPRSHGCGEPRLAGCNPASYLSAPVVGPSGDMVGGLFLAHREPARFTEAHERSLAGLASQAAVVLHKARLDAELREREARLRLALESSEFGTWDYSFAARALRCSPRTLSLFDLPSSAPINSQVFFARIAAEDRERVSACAAAAMDPAGEGTCEIEFRTLSPPHSRPRWLTTRGQVLFSDDGQPLRFIGTIADVTEDRESRRELTHANDMLRRLQAVTARLSQASTRTEVIDVVLEHGAAATAASAINVFLLSPERDQLVWAAGVGSDPDQVRDFRTISIDSPVPLCQSIRGGNALFLDSSEDFAAWPALWPVNEASRSGAVAAVPLLAHGQALGALGLSFAEPRRFEPQDQAFLSAIADQCAQALDRARLLEAERAARLHAGRLLAITSAFSRALTPEEVSEVALSMGTQALEADIAGLWRIDHAGQMLELVHDINLSPELRAQSLRIPLASSFTSARAARERRPVFVQTPDDAVVDGPDSTRTPELLRLRTRGLLPLMVDDRVIGVLGCGFADWRPIEEPERSFLVSLANQCAQALDRARLYHAERMARQEAEAAQRRADFLSESSAVLTSSLDYETTLASVTRLAVPTIADWCIIDLCADPGGPRASIIAHPDPAKVELVRELRRGFAGGADLAAGPSLVIETGEAQWLTVNEKLIASVAPDAERQRALTALGLRSTVIVPMKSRGRILGAITLCTSTESGRMFERADLEMARHLGRRAALAIDNALLYSEARKADQRKDEFLAMLGHELRNPLAPILTALQVMQLRGSGGQREQDVIERQVRHLMRLVDDLLDVSRITRGKVTLHTEPIEMATVVAKAIEMASPLFEQRAHVLDVQVARSGLVVNADPVRLAQVVANLLTNAARYTDPGGRVEVEARRQHDRERDRDEITVSVTDNGIGIDPGQVARVFDPFVQTNSAVDRSRGGLGIGLTLARSLAELHGGAISVASEGPGRGSRFTVRLPAAVRQGAKRPPRSPSTGNLGADDERAERPPGRRVLVVDDNADAAEIMSDALRALGHEVATAHDGVEALAMAEHFHPDTALLDIGLPVMDGYELARRLRDLLPSLAPRLIAITGYGQDADKERTRQAGFAHHLIKPVDLARVQELLIRAPPDPR